MASVLLQRENFKLKKTNKHKKQTVIQTFSENGQIAFRNAVKN